MSKYDFTAIESKWQQYWETHGTFSTPNPGEAGFDPDRPKYFCLDFFPYPSGAGLHVGHPEGYTATDVLARWRRMCGYNVLHPMGWDAFGLPAEQYAVETNTHPRITTQRNIATFKRQLKSLGFSYDWSREFATTDPEYYRWTQWIFLRLFDSYYDEAEQRARPIAELVKKLENEKLVVRFDGTLGASGPTGMQQVGGIPVGDRFWHELTPAERNEVLDEYRLAYVTEAPVNWCPALGTVLSNEEVTNDGRSERGNHPVFRRPLKQWMLRITAYADRLISDLEGLDWPEPVKLMQRNWIGRSEGARVKFVIARKGTGGETAGTRDDGTEEAAAIEVFTTRPDTLFGATYMVLSPEHPLVDSSDEDCIVAATWPMGISEQWRGAAAATPRDAVRAYQQAAERKTDRDRTVDAKVKTGVFTGAYALNPVYSPDDPRARIPIFVADYVLMGYGTGAIMAVPGHDTRDLEFAKAFDLPVLQVVQPVDGSDWRGYVADGIALNSPPTDSKAECDLNGLPTPEAKRKIAAWLEANGRGRFEVQYKLRDWLFSRQRYWGEPFPVVHGDDGCVYAVADEELPVTLPEVADFRPRALPEDSDAEPEPPLGRAMEWLNVRFWLDEHGRAHTHGVPDGGETSITYASGRRLLSGRRETNTMPNWAGSCWYYLRYCDPKNNAAFCGAEAERYWMVSLKRDGTLHKGGVDLYLGGTEHAVLHLLYARFWHKVLFDLGCVHTPEPFGKLFNQGMIRAFAYRDARGVPHGYDEIDFRDDGAFLKAGGEKLNASVEKMSKTLKNVINPDDVVRDWGADALRLYELFMGPLEASKPWNPRDVPGVFRFLQRAWRLVVDPETGGLNAKIVDGSESAQFPVPGAQSASPNPVGRVSRPDDSGDAMGGTGNVGSEDPTCGASTPKSKIQNPKWADRRDNPVERALHRAIKKVTDDLGRMAYNTAISAMMEFANVATSAERLHRDQVARFVLILAPFAPHLCEELWERLAETSKSQKVKTSKREMGTLAYEPWPTYDESLTVDDQIEIPVQINGKVRARIMVARDADQAALEAAARADATVAAAMEGKTVRKVVVVPGRMVNIVVA